MLRLRFWSWTAGAAAPAPTPADRHDGADTLKRRRRPLARPMREVTFEENALRSRALLEEPAPLELAEPFVQEPDSSVSLGETSVTPPPAPQARGVAAVGDVPAAPAELDPDPAPELLASIAAGAARRLEELARARIVAERIRRERISRAAAQVEAARQAAIRRDVELVAVARFVVRAA
jgi:hypothetical protein